MSFNTGLGLARIGRPLFYPDATLALDFTTGAYRVGAGGTATPDFSSLSGLTVSRASVGYAERSDGTLVQFGNNVARITDKGLLVEESRTNLVPTSNSFTPQGAGTTMVSTTIDAPDATLTASRFTMDQTTEDKISSSSVNVSASTTYTGAVWLRGIAGQTATVFVKRFTGATLATASQAVTFNGRWQRVKDVVLTTAADTLTAGVRVSNAGGQTATQIDVWGAQLELGNTFSSSQINTNGASATRAADSVSIGGLSVAQPFSMVSGLVSQVTADGTTRRLVTLSDGTVNNRVMISRLADNSLSVSAVNGGSAQGAAVGASGITGAFSAKAASAVIGGPYRVSANGGAVTSNLSAPSVTYSRLDVGQAPDGSGQANGYVPRVLLYASGLSDQQLQAATQ